MLDEGDFGQLNWPSSTPPVEPPPLNLAFMREPDDLSASCFLKTHGTSICSNRYIDGTTGVVQVSQNCVLKNNGEVICQPSGTYNTMSAATIAKANFEAALAGVTRIESNCGILPDTSIVCYNDNRPGDITPPSGITDVYDIAEGKSRT